MPRDHRTERRGLGRLVAGVVIAGAMLTNTVAVPFAAAKATTTSAFTMKRLSSPSRTLVYDASKVLVATFTDGARTVTLRGPSRTFTEPSTTTATVTSTTWVRLLAAPFNGTIDQAWLTARLADTSPDVLATSMQYIAGAPPVLDGAGLQVAGDAAYGPLLADGTRAEGSDFNDYLGISWSYPSGSVDAPEADQFRSLDCSGFMRMLFGYRNGVAMSLAADGGRSLPRRSVDMAAAAPGILVIANTGAVPTSRSLLLPGDLVFFDADSGDGTAIDHVGMYLGRDSLGNDRFISSRKTANGPTLGDLGGRSTLNGTGYYAAAFRAARRL